MITIVSGPSDYIFCRNKSYITVSTNNFSGQQGFKLLCHIQLYDGFAWITKATLSGYINAANEVKFRVDEAILPYADWATLALNNGVSTYGKVVMLKFVEYYNQAEHNALNADFIAVPFGRNYIHEQDSDIETKYFTTTASDKKFLCNRPQHTTIGLDTPLLLFGHINSNSAHHIKMFADYAGVTDAISMVTDYAINNKGNVLRHYFNLKDTEIRPYPGTDYAQIVLKISDYPSDGQKLVLHTLTGNKEIRFKSTHVAGWIYNNNDGEDSYLDDWAVSNIQDFVEALLTPHYTVSTVSGGADYAIITITAEAPGIDSNLWIVSNDMPSFFYEISNTNGSRALTDEEKLQITNLRFVMFDNATQRSEFFYVDIKRMYNRYQERAFAYRNTFGTWEWMFTHGKAKAKDFIIDSEAFLYADNPAGTVVFNPELVNINAEWNSEITINTGHSSAADFESFKQFMLSAQRYELVDGKLLPIVLVSKDAEGNDDNRTIYNRTFKYKYSINDINY
jgi:hypothetical protein